MCCQSDGSLSTSSLSASGGSIAHLGAQRRESEGAPVPVVAGLPQAARPDLQARSARAHAHSVSCAARPACWAALAAHWVAHWAAHGAHHCLRWAARPGRSAGPVLPLLAAPRAEAWPWDWTWPARSSSAASAMHETVTSLPTKQRWISCV